MSKFLPNIALVAGGAIILVIASAAADLSGTNSINTIGATANITEDSSGVALTARVDTGARATSLHCSEDDLVIIDESPIAEENIGKPARLRVQNVNGESAWISTRIDSHIEVRNAEHAERRYCVVLPLQHKGVRKRTLVTLNDRSTMSYRMLLGRNFLDGNFVVDVSRQGPGEH